LDGDKGQLKRWSRDNGEISSWRWVWRLENVRCQIFYNSL
jgi:hypothetical protein